MSKSPLVILCLACSSSILPKLEVFRTNCCQRPICSSCVSANPRLTRYDPCLACLGGVAVVASKSPTKGIPQPANIDAAVRDEDTFQIGDDDEDADSGDESDLDSAVPPPSYKSHPSTSESGLTTPSSLSVSSVSTANDTSSSSAPPAEEQPPPTEIKQSIDPSAPVKYYIRKGDTLHGISLRFSVPSRELCKLNNLPPSTLSTTPHLLHTRASILLPASAASKLPSVSPLTEQEEREREVRRLKERAEKRLQTLTKEVDWRVAKVYVSLAEDANEDDVDMFHVKRKEYDLSGSKSSKDDFGKGKVKGMLETMAVDSYLDDQEWEERNPMKLRGLDGTFPSSSAGPSKASRSGGWKSLLGVKA